MDTGSAASLFNNKKSLFLVIRQWSAADIITEIAEDTVMMAWPKLPDEKSNMAGTVAAAPTPGYGLTTAISDEKMEAGLKFIQFFNSHAEVTERMKQGSIPGSILKDFIIPPNLSYLNKQKATLGATADITDVIDADLQGTGNTTLEIGMQNIVLGKTTAAEVAAAVEAAVR